MKTKVIMVDKDDTVIGHKLYADIDFKREIYRVSRLWVTDIKGNILLQKRSSTVAIHQNKWACAVGGTNDEGETYESNIIKEAKEEIGLEIMHPTFLHHRLEQEPLRNLWCTYFAYQIKEIKPLLKFDAAEVVDLKWVSLSELKSLLQLHPNSFSPDIFDIVSGFSN